MPCTCSGKCATKKCTCVRCDIECTCRMSTCKNRAPSNRACASSSATDAHPLPRPAASATHPLHSVYTLGGNAVVPGNPLGGAVGPLPHVFYGYDDVSCS